MPGKPRLDERDGGVLAIDDNPGDETTLPVVVLAPDLDVVPEHEGRRELLGLAAEVVSGLGAVDVAQADLHRLAVVA